jgi:hypothetical protein
MGLFGLNIDSFRTSSLPPIVTAALLLQDLTKQMGACCSCLTMKSRNNKIQKNQKAAFRQALMGEESVESSSIGLIPGVTSTISAIGLYTPPGNSSSPFPKVVGNSLLTIPSHLELKRSAMLEKRGHLVSVHPHAFFAFILW